MNAQPGLMGGQYHPQMQHYPMTPNMRHSGAHYLHQYGPSMSAMGDPGSQLSVVSNGTQYKKKARANSQEEFSKCILDKDEEIEPEVQQFGT